MNTGINENIVRTLAYNIWEAEGKPLGQAERHWQMALEQAEANGDDQYLAGQNFLGDEMIPGNSASMLGNDREYSRIADIQMEQEDTDRNVQHSLDSGSFKKSAKRNKSETRASILDENAENSKSSKSKSSKRKSSDNNIVA